MSGCREADLVGPGGLAEMGEQQLVVGIPAGLLQAAFHRHPDSFSLSFPLRHPGPRVTCTSPTSQNELAAQYFKIASQLIWQWVSRRILS